MAESVQVWQYAGSYEATGPGYQTSGVELYRGPGHRLAWATACSRNSPLHPAFLRINPKTSTAILRLINQQTGQEVDIPIPIQMPLKVSPDSIELRIENKTEKSIKLH